MSADSLTTELDVARFTDWYQRITGERAKISLRTMAGGASCEMYRVDAEHDDQTRTWVLRRAPQVRVSGSAHQVEREARIMQALSGSGVPVPVVLGVEGDPAVLGAPFFVMSYLEGEVVRRKGLPAAYLADPKHQPDIGAQLIDTLSALHDVPWRGTALEGLAHPEGFLERQVERWRQQLGTYQCRDLPGVDSVAMWLDAHRPSDGDLTVMHGDYKIDNLLWSPSAPPRVVAVLDFEMTTVGDPLIDLAWAMIFWPEEGNLIALAAPGSPGGMDPAHTQSPQELVARYAASAGRDLASFDWYQAFSAWKLAIVLEASYAKFLSGESHNPHHELFGSVVDHLLDRAGRFAQ